jgi:hypothetical protein
MLKLFDEHCLSTASGLNASVPDSLFCAAHPSSSYIVKGMALHLSLLSGCKQPMGTLGITPNDMPDGSQVLLSWAPVEVGSLNTPMPADYNSFIQGVLAW